MNNIKLAQTEEEIEQRGKIFIDFMKKNNTTNDPIINSLIDNNEGIIKSSFSAGYHAAMIEMNELLETE